MIIFLSGKNTYSRSKKLREILSVYHEKSGGLEPKEFDFSEDLKDTNGKEITKDFISHLNSGNLFGEKKIIVLTNPFDSGDKKELKKVFQDSLEDKNQILIITSAKDAPKSFSFLKEKPVVFQDFPEIKKGKELDNFILKEAKARGLKLTKDNIYHLAENFGVDLWGITTELDKLALSGSEVMESISHDFFKTLSTIKFSNSVEERLYALEVLLTIRKDDAAKIFNMLSFGLNDEQKLKALADYDKSIKIGKLNYEEALLDFVIN